jgi:hypothetical protein
MSAHRPHRRGVDKITRRPFLRMTGIVGGAWSSFFACPCNRLVLLMGQAKVVSSTLRNQILNPLYPQLIESIAHPRLAKLTGVEPSPSWLSIDPCVTAAVVESPASSLRSFCSGVLSDRLVG